MLDTRFMFDSASAILLFATALTGAYLPRHLAMKGTMSTESSNSVAFHLGNMLSAGVMLSAGFCHLLADSLHTLAFVGKRFPMASFLAALGYLVTLLADQIVQYIQDSESENTTRRSKSHESNLLDLVKSPMLRRHTENSSAEKLNMATRTLHIDDCETLYRDETITLASQRRDATSYMPLNANCHLEIEGPSKPVDDKDNTCAPMNLLFGRRPLSFATAVLLAGALCVHSILEGMALGAQRTMQSTEDIMIAIAAHKGLAAYALGASIVESKASSKRFWIVVVGFSAATPIGILIGYAFSEISSGTYGAALSALASGTFLYVAMMEVIPKELADPSCRLWKMVMLATGFGLMSLLAIWA